MGYDGCVAVLLSHYDIDAMACMSWCGATATSCMSYDAYVVGCMVTMTRVSMQGACHSGGPLELAQGTMYAWGLRGGVAGTNFIFYFLEIFYNYLFLLSYKNQSRTT